MDLDPIGGGIFEVHGGVHRVVVDLDRVGSVAGQVLVVGHHHGDRFADMAHLSVRQERLQGPHRNLRQQRPEMANVLDGVNGVYTRHLEGCRRIDRVDHCTGVRATHEGSRQLAGEPDVLYVAAGARDQRRILLALDRLAEQPGSGHTGTSSHSAGAGVSPRIFAAAYSMARTMLW